MNIKPHNKYFIEVDFPWRDFCLEFRDKMIENFIDQNPGIQLETKINEGYPQFDGTSTRFENDRIKTHLGMAYYKVLNQLFDNLGEPMRPFLVWNYVQNNQFYQSNYHEHLDTATINSTMYLDEIQEGGELSIFVHNKEQIIKVQPNKLYIFPSWLLHKPLPQKDSNWRVCINLEHLSNTRVYSKHTECFW